MIRYARGRSKFDAYPVIREAPDFDAFERAVLDDRARTKGRQYVASPFKINGDGRAHRGKDEAEPRRFHPLDFDFIADADTSAELRMRMAAYRGFGFTTASHNANSPRLRIVLELDREVDRTEGMRLGAAIERDLYEEFGDRIKLDATVYRGEQPCFGPLVHSETFRLDGDPLAVDTWLADAPEIEPERKGAAAIAPGDDPVIVALKERGMYRRDLGAGRHAIRCPWGSTHTSEDPETSTATAYLQPHHAGYVTPGFACKHDHCKSRKGDDLLAFLGVDWREVKDAYGGSAKASHSVAEPPEYIDDVPPREGATSTAGRPATASEWPAPLDIFRDVIAKPFSLGDVPAPVAQFSDAFTRSTGFDRSAAIVACVGAAAACIDDRYRLAVRHGAGWFESARLWVALIGGPSTGKSPTIRAATDPIKHLHREQWAKWQKVNATLKPEERDPEPCIYTSDATLEALSDVLKDNARGVLMLTEEFASWIGSIDAYRNGQGSRDRGEMLQLYDGGPHQVHRVKRGSFLVPNWGASVIAAGTPAGLRQQVKQLPDDGLIHRFIPCILQRPAPSGGASIREALETWERMLRHLFESTVTAETAQRARLTPEAAAIFEAEAAAIREATADAESLAPALASHLGKHPGMIARTALVFHLLRHERTEGIAASTVEMACRFMRTARRHASVLFLDILQSSPVRELARGVGRSIAASTDAPEQLSRAWLSSHCRQFRDAPDYQRRSAVEFLEDAHWIRPLPDSRPYAGWAATAWAVNPEVSARFANVGEEHRQRRENVRRAFLGEGA